MMILMMDRTIPMVEYLVQCRTNRSPRRTYHSNARTCLDPPPPPPRQDPRIGEQIAQLGGLVQQFGGAVHHYIGEGVHLQAFVRTTRAGNLVRHQEEQNIFMQNEMNYRAEANDTFMRNMKPK